MPDTSASHANSSTGALGFARDNRGSQSRQFRKRSHLPRCACDQDAGAT